VRRTYELFPFISAITNCTPRWVSSTCQASGHAVLLGQYNPLINHNFDEKPCLVYPLSAEIASVVKHDPNCKPLSFVPLLPGGVDEIVDWSKTAPKRKFKRPADTAGDFDDKVR